jgi:peptidoglycan/xylan/chitin deacetylase (PgdA/CDA1 family)
VRKTRNTKAVIFSFGRILRSAESAGDYPAGRALNFSTFMDHLRFLDRNFEIIGLRDFCRQYLTGRRFVRPTAVITFDYCGDGLYKDIAPVLDDRGIKAVVFVPTEKAGTLLRLDEDRVFLASRQILERRSELMEAFPDEDMPSACSFVIKLLVADAGFLAFCAKAFDVLEALPFDAREDALEWLERLGGVVPAAESSVLTWEHIKGLHEIGWELGTAIDALGPLAEGQGVSLEDRITTAYRKTQTEAGCAPVALAHPAGFPDVRIERIARRVGFRCAVTGVAGYADNKPNLFALPRLQVSQGNAPNVKRLETLLSFIP